MEDSGWKGAGGGGVIGRINPIRLIRPIGECPAGHRRK
jgi:hypothetical protein